MFLPNSPKSPNNALQRTGSDCHASCWRTLRASLRQSLIFVSLGDWERMPTETPSLTRKFIATALGVVTLLCAILFYLSFAFVMWQVYGGVYDGPVLVVVALFVTAPPAAVCTIIALILVRPQRSRLAWISLCSYPLFFILMLGIALCVPHH
jgi:hypothetical protein